MKHRLPESMPLFSESPEDELRYFFGLSRGIIKKRIEDLSAAATYNSDISQLRLLDEMILEQLPALSPSEAAK